MSVNLGWFNRGRSLWRMVTRHLKSSTPVLLLLALAFALVAIWWLGPQWEWRGEKPLAPLSMRLALSIFLVLIPVVIWAWVTRSRYRRLQEQQLRQEAAETDPLRVYEEAQERALDMSLDLLRQNLHSRDYLYKLPWYVVLGQENSGKTSFINRSNQSFALTSVSKASKRPSRQVESPLKIDWWIGNDAVLIDPAGELISQQDVQQLADAGSEDDYPADFEAQYKGMDTSGNEQAYQQIAQNPDLPRRLWTHFVGWLGRHRARRPLNGAILIVDLSTLLTQKASDRKALAVLIRARLRELMEQLGTRLPIYVVLSKFDLVRGFDTFFASLPRAARENSLGFTCTLSSVDDFDAWAEELSQQYDRFIQNLNEQVFDAMAAKPGLAEREDMFVFVRQLAGVKPVLLSFLDEVFESDRYSTPALVRGMYFSSVYQQGVPANAFVNAAAQSYGMPPAVSEALPAGRAATYFTDRLFQKIVYPEAGLAGDNISVLRSKRRLMWISTGVVALGCLVVIGGWQYHYAVNRQKAYAVLDKSKAFIGKQIDERLDPTGRNLLTPLNQIRDAVSVFDDYRAAWPLVSGMGLYQGRTIGPKVDAAYMRLLGQRFLPQLGIGVMDRLNASEPGSDERLAALRVYRMIEDRENRSPAMVESWMAREWRSAFPTDGRTQGQLMNHLSYAMKYVDADLPQYRTMVAQVQTELRQVPLPQRVYATMKRDSATVLPASLDLRSEIGPVFDILYRQPDLPVTQAGAVPANPLIIDRVLTDKGFKDYFAVNSKDMTRLALIDQWTLGYRTDLKYSDEDRKQLTAQIRDLYTADYIATWRQGLNSLNVTEFRDVDHAALVLESTIGASQPLRRLLDTVRRNTSIYQPLTVGGAEAVAEAEKKLTEDPDWLQAKRIEREFAPLSGLLVAQGEQPAYLDETNKAMVALYDYVKAVQNSPDRGQAALNAMVGHFKLEGTDPIFTLKRMSNGLPEPLNRQVGTIADESAKVLMIEALRELEKRWDHEVYGFYRERLAGRYPLNPASSQNVALEDFEAFFGPQGRLQEFYGKYLKLFFEDNYQALYSESRGEYLVNPQVQQQLKAAQQIREAFFDNRGALALQFNVEPLALSADQLNSVLNVDGQLVSYGHGSHTPIGLIWPNTLREGVESKVTLVNTGGNTRALRFQGPWAWFRLLSQAQLNGTTASSVDLSFKAGEGSVRYRITADKPVNPFTQRIFNGFVLPRSLLRSGSETVASETASE
ncbi:type VI secretion system membrane subunit TssM [Pseudoxanthomonas putridarboris]|uniref:Type VI secretion system membrane subunit TssM n=1 Tax=Pseudoxanthomonas putridarboris TaxID=752605 RepID=A0ABU9J6U7_9GAMM